MSERLAWLGLVLLAESMKLGQVSTWRVHHSFANRSVLNTNT